MKILQKLTIFVILTLLSTSVTSFVVQVTCKPCSISCQYSNCYKISSTDGYDEEICSTSSCSLSYNVNMTVSQCQANSNGASCSSGLCITSTTMNMCMSNGYCPSSYWMYSSCGTCTTIACSGKCMITETSLIPGTQEQCIGQSCSGIQTMNVTVSPCSSGTDYFGNACNCCMSGSIVGDLFLTCSQSSGIFSSQKFKTYSVNKLNSQKKQKNNQRYTIYAISLMLLLLGVLAL